MQSDTRPDTGFGVSDFGNRRRTGLCGLVAIARCLGSGPCALGPPWRGLGLVVLIGMGRAGWQLDSGALRSTGSGEAAGVDGRGFGVRTHTHVALRQLCIDHAPHGRLTVGRGAWISSLDRTSIPLPPAAAAGTCWSEPQARQGGSELDITTRRSCGRAARSTPGDRPLAKG